MVMIHNHFGNLMGRENVFLICVCELTALSFPLRYKIKALVGGFF
jgi:hypothetical protein